MVTRALMTFIREEQLRGESPDRIKKALLERGWSDSTVEEGLQLVARTHGVPMPPSAKGRLPGALDLIAVSWWKYCAKWKTYVGVSLVYLLVLVAVMGMTTLLYVANIPLILSAISAGQGEQLLAYFAPFFIPVGIFLVFFQLVMVSALYIAARKDHHPVEQTYRMAFEAFPQALLVKVFAVLSSIGILIPPILLALLAHGQPSVFFGLFFVVAAICSIIMGVLVMFSLVAYFESGEKGVHAVGKSIILVRGRFFSVVGRIIVFAAVITLCSLIVERIAPFLAPLLIIFVAMPFQVLFMIELYHALDQTPRKPVAAPLPIEKPKSTPRAPKGTHA